VILLSEVQKTIEEIIQILKKRKDLDEYSIYDTCSKLYQLLVYFFDSEKDEEKALKVQTRACKYAITDLIPLVEKRLEVCDEEYTNKYYRLYQNAYAFAGRRSLEHFIDYIEWDMPKKVLGTRRDVLKPLVFYLNKSAFDPKLEYVVASYPPSYGKSYTLNMFSAWIYGLKATNSILRMSYSEELVLGFSRAVQGTIKNPRYGDVFPDFKKYGEKPFMKEKESDWILKGKGADVQPSHIARTREGSVTGVRASKAIIFDDMTKGASEATNSTVHQNIYNGWKTEWYNRRTGKETKYIFAGTMWSPEDILNRVSQDIESSVEVVPSKKFRYVWETVDGSAVFIRIPLLDENDESTCPDVMSTKEARRLRDTTDPFLWACVYQQEPIAPTGLEFAWENLQTFEQIPEDAENYCVAVIDPTRRGKDNFAMPILRPFKDRYLLDNCIFQQKASRELYDAVVHMIILYNIRKLVVEENTDESLAKVIGDKLKAKGHSCEIITKYSTVKKENRIRDMRFDVVTRIMFRDKKTIKPNSDYGRFMKNLTTYSFDYPNKHDDAPDSICMCASELIVGRSKPNIPRGIDRRLLGI
jgi:hypothetical protein